MNMDKLVPPLKMCKLIPEGEFADSAFLWEAAVDMNTGETVNTRTIPRPSRTGCNPFVYHEIAKEFHLYPAPTLEEILQELVNLSVYCIKVCKSWGEWHIDCCDDQCHIEKDSVKNITTAAMKLWLKLKGIEYAEK